MWTRHANDTAERNPIFLLWRTTAKPRFGVRCMAKEMCFSLKVERNTRVHELRVAIFRALRYNERPHVVDSNLTLYEARTKRGEKDGEWLKNDRELDRTLRSGVSAEYDKMRQSGTLEACFGLWLTREGAQTVATSTQEDDAVIPHTHYLSNPFDDSGAFEVPSSPELSAMENNQVEIWYAEYGGGNVFPLKIDRNTPVHELRAAIFREMCTNKQSVFVDHDLTLYEARAKNREWLKSDRNLRRFLRSGISTEYEEMPPQWSLERCFGKDFKLGCGDIHVLVELPTNGTPDAKRLRLDPYAEMQQLWRSFDDDLTKVPAASQLKTRLMQPLPFRLPRLVYPMDSDKIFKKDGPVVDCEWLTTTLRYVGHLYSNRPDADATESLWQQYYDVLLAIPIDMCRFNDILLREKRHKTFTIPDYVLLHNKLVLLRGEERHAKVEMGKTLKVLARKTRKWSPVLYGDLPYIIGYATAGSSLQLVAIERSDGQCQPTTILELDIVKQREDALKVFFNLGVVLYQLAVTTKHSCTNALTPFTLDMNEKRTLVLLDGVIERTIQLGQCDSKADFERVVGVYKTLQKLKTVGSDLTHLQTVERVRAEDAELLVELSPVGYDQHPESGEVGQWLEHMLTALKCWHGRGYCHGNVSWRNIVFVSTGESVYWLLIGMDTSQRQSEDPSFRFEHDLCQLLELLSEVKGGLSESLKNILVMLESASFTRDVTAESVLAQLWTDQDVAME